jgi:nucleoid-associated protein YgaU
LCSIASAAKEATKQVTEVTDIAAREIESASLAGRSAKPRSCGAKPSNFVVLFALLGVTEHVVRRGDFLELLL